jgi:cell division septal protein FtsQ
MPEKKGKILGTVLFVLLISLLIFLTFMLNNKTEEKKIQMIKLSGNSLLPVKDYLKFTKLDDVSSYSGLTLSVIKDRFEKHPYVEYADVEYENKNLVSVEIKEKKIEAILLDGSEPHFITEDFQVLPYYENTKFVDYPIISNMKEKDKIKSLEILKSDDTKHAFRIIETIKLTNSNILKRLSEINLGKGGDIVLTFSGLKPLVIFGRGDEAKKMVYLEILWEGKIESKVDITKSNYVDLRFANEVFLGNANGTDLVE